MLEPQILEKPALNVIGLEAPFITALAAEATNFQVIGPLWQKFFPSVGQIENRIGKEMVGLMYSKPATERSHPHELQYIAAVRVESLEKIPKGMVGRSIPAGQFAVFMHRGPIAKIGDTCREIYQVWLPKSGFFHSDIADIEIYDHRFCPDSDDSIMEYWISVRQK